MSSDAPGTRKRVGRMLLSSAVVMLALAVAFLEGWIPLDPGARPVVTAILVVAALVDAAVGLRFLGTSG